MFAVATAIPKVPSYSLYEKIVSYASAAQRPSLKEELYKQIDSRSERYIKAEIDFDENMMVTLQTAYEDLLKMLLFFEEEWEKGNAKPSKRK